MTHIPVLADEILSLMRDTPVPVSCFLDGTFGRGGHARLVMDEFSSVKVVAFDQDVEALNDGMEHFSADVENKKIHFIHSNFVNVKEHQSEISDFIDRSLFSGILLDLGVSSPQLDEAGRGFSFYRDGPLDMRMNRDQNLSAGHIINEWGESELIELFQRFGDVRGPQRVVQTIVEDRKKRRFESTLQLAGVIERVQGWKRKGHHPATPFFLALRLAVNRELEAVEKAIPHLIELLEEGGRLFIITFHSLEDRIVKYIFKSFENHGVLVNKKVIQAKWSEKKQNPRARSAKLRVFQRGNVTKGSVICKGEMPHESNNGHG